MSMAREALVFCVQGALIILVILISIGIAHVISSFYFLSEVYSQEQSSLLGQVNF